MERDKKIILFPSPSQHDPDNRILAFFSQHKIAFVSEVTAEEEKTKSQMKSGCIKG